MEIVRSPLRWRILALVAKPPPPAPKAAEEREGEEQQHNYLSFLLQNLLVFFFFLKHVLDFSQFRGFWFTEKIKFRPPL